MTIDDLEYFRDRLLERKDGLASWLGSKMPIDGNNAERARQVLNQIKDALDRIENESYGQCTVCHDEIERERLESQPEVEVCLDCLSDKEKRSIEDDMKMAGRLQRALLPPTIPKIDGFTVSAKMLGASSVGGDYYDFLPYGGGSMSRIIIADAMGHGIASGLLMSNLQGALRVLSQDIESPGELVSRLNQWLCRNVPITKFVSLTCLCFEKTDTPETEVTYVNAGHCPPILMRSDGSCERLDVTGGILGVHEQFGYEENKTTLRAGDFLLLYTDGVVETENPDGEVFGEEGVIDYISNHERNNVDNFINDLVGEIARFSDSSNRSDDMTLLGLLKL
jgi:sigma-B regulation protein RsbU (phosphoserine phosphatase)